MENNKMGLEFAIFGVPNWWACCKFNIDSVVVLSFAYNLLGFNRSFRMYNATTWYIDPLFHVFLTFLFFVIYR